MIRYRPFQSSPNADVALRLLGEIAKDQRTHQGRPVDKPLALYGAGSLGHMARDYLDRIGIPICYVIDSNAQALRNDAFWQGTPVFTPDEVTAEMRQGMLLALCVVTAPYAPLAHQLADAGWNDVVPFYDIAEHYRDRHPLSNGWFAPPFSPTELDNMSKVLRMWDDDTSRAHHLQFIAWRRLREEWAFQDAKVDTSNRFFIPEVLAVLNERERFLDAGAYHGQVTLSFLLHMKNRCEAIWDVEPDGDSRAQLQKAIASLDTALREKIAVLPWVLGASNASSPFFSGLGYASQCTPLGTKRLPCRTIDSLGLSPSFIKLHLEGMELATLEGARETLRRYRPVIVATLYHNDDGLWRTPLWLGKNLPDYQLTFRLHAWCGTGATAYAIPKKRETALSR